MRAARKSWVVIAALCLAFSAAAQAPQKRACTQTIQFFGTDAHGRQRSATINVGKRFYDWTPEQLEGRFDPIRKVFFRGVVEEEARKYQGWDYKPLGANTRTIKKDCAGLVMESLWPTGEFNVTGEQMTNEVIKVFGRQISNPQQPGLEPYERPTATWGDPAPGDIVVYGVGKHVALVEKYEQGQITILTKDGGEMIYRKVLNMIPRGLHPANDPLAKYGQPVIWRVDRSKVFFRKVPGGDCDENTGACSGRSESFDVPNFKPVKMSTSFSTSPGCTYLIKASGQVSDWSDHKDGVDPVWCYAKWRCGERGEPWQQLRIDGKGMIELAGRDLPPNPSHAYEIRIKGTGRPLEFHCADAIGSWGDNSGSFHVTVTEEGR